MEIRPATVADLQRFLDIDGTIETLDYLHVERKGEDLPLGWWIESRPLRTKMIDANPLDEDTQFLYRQIASGADEGLALVAEHDGTLAASLLAQVEPDRKVLRLIDLRVDYDQRRQGLGSVLLFRTIQEARDRGLRAVTARTSTSNFPAARFLLKGSFEMAGLDAKFCTNHDLVKEAVSLFWYASLD